MQLSEIRANDRLAEQADLVITTTGKVLKHRCGPRDIKVLMIDESGRVVSTDHAQ